MIILSKLVNCVFLPEYVHLGEQIFIQCSRITVVHVHVNILSKIRPVCHNDANGIKARSDSKKTDKHAAGYSKTVCLCVT